MNAQLIAQVAAHLNIAPNQIKRCEEWASVLFVVVHGCRPRFVSKEAVKMNVEILKTVTTWGGDELLLAECDGEKRVFIARFSAYSGFGGKSFLAKDVTAQSKGLTVAQMMDWHFDAFHRLPLTDDAIANQLKVAV